MTFTIRPSTTAIATGLLNSYRHNPKMALLTVKTGGGKTYGAIHTFGQLFSNSTLLVFTTAKVAKSKQWETSVKDYNQVMGTNLKIICYNYDKLVNQRFLNQLAEKLQLVSNDRICLILDEVHRIKLAGNGKLSKRSHIIMQLAKQPYITTTLGLSATAFSNSYLDVAPYLVIAGYYHSKTQFMKEHIKRFNEYWQPIVTDWTGNVSRSAFKDPDKIDREIKSISVYVDTSNYLPILTKKHHVFNLANNEASQYNEIMQDYCRGETYEFPIQARMAQEHKLATDLAWHKDLYLLSILKRREQNKFGVKAPVLIFYQYTAVYEHLKNLLHVAYPDYNIIGVNGFTNLTSDELSKPKSNNSIYLVQYEAGGEGLDWQWSNISIFYEAPVRYEKFVQAKGRNLRNKSQMSHVYHFELEYASTLDSERWETNRGKRDFTDDVSERTFKAQVAQFKNMHDA